MITYVMILANLCIAMVLCFLALRTVLKGNRYADLVEKNESVLKESETLRDELKEQQVDIANTKKWLEKTCEAWTKRHQDLDSDRRELDTAIKIFNAKVTDLGMVITSEEIQKAAKENSVI